MNPLTLAAVLLLCAAAHAAPDRCSLKPDAGPCEALIPKYFFDQATRTCRKFNWGGCQGVVPFDTLADCNAAKCTTAANPCTLKPETGRCRARKIRYFFDQTTNSCRTFTWGGCGGVVPFTTAADCKAAKCLGEDPCTLKPEVGPCRASIPMYFFDQTTKKCKMFRWGGCKGVVPFKTAAECEASKCAVEDPCTLKPEVGPCRASIPRYFFDKTSKTCKMFRWGGCKGVAPFKTATECKAAQCSGQDPCTLKPEGGPCRASIPKYFFDQTSKTCKRFTWGGCKGVVPFQTAASCKAAQCSGSVGSTGTDPCMLKPARGLCKAYKPRYFWNASTNVSCKACLKDLLFATLD